MAEISSGDPNKRALEVIEAMRRTEVAREARYVWQLTGQRPTIRELVENSDLNRLKINELLRREGMLVNPLPEVRTDLLPKNQHAFFKGLSYGYSIKEISWSGHTYITVATSSKDPKKHVLLDSLEYWGSVHHNGGNNDNGDGGRLVTVAYLSPLNFSFLKASQSPGPEILLSKTKFPPFVLGDIAGSLMEKTHRLPLKESLRQSITGNFKNQFGFPIGTERRENSHGHKLIVLYVTDLGRVMDALYGVENVKRLPFGQTVRELILPAAA